MHLTFLLLGTSSSFVFPLAAFSSFARTSSGESRTSRQVGSVANRATRERKGHRPKADRRAARKPTRRRAR